MRALALCVCLIACGPSAAERSRCYTDAEAAAQARVNRECPGRFDTCSHADSIVAELKAAQEACP